MPSSPTLVFVPRFVFLGLWYALLEYNKASTVPPLVALYESKQDLLERCREAQGRYTVLGGGRTREAGPQKEDEARSQNNTTD